MYGCMQQENSWSKLAYGSVHLSSTTALNAENVAFNECTKAITHILNRQYVAWTDGWVADVAKPRVPKRMRS